MMHPIYDCYWKELIIHRANFSEAKVTAITPVLKDTRLAKEMGNFNLGRNYMYSYLPSLIAVNDGGE
jgi:hypothetical protein